MITEFPFYSFGNVGDGCDTIATAFDLYRGTDTTEFALAGMTKSQSLIQGLAYPAVDLCSDFFVPFLMWVHNGVSRGLWVFKDIVTLNGVTGRYSNVTTIMFADLATSTSGYYHNNVISVLEFSDLAGNVVNEGTTIQIWKANNILTKSIVVNTPPIPHRKDLAWYNG